MRYSYTLELQREAIKEDIKRIKTKHQITETEHLINVFEIHLDKILAKYTESTQRAYNETIDDIKFKQDILNVAHSFLTLIEQQKYPEAYKELDSFTEKYQENTPTTKKIINWTISSLLILGVIASPIIFAVIMAEPIFLVGLCISLIIPIGILAPIAIDENLDKSYEGRFNQSQVAQSLKTVGNMAFTPPTFFKPVDESGVKQQAEVTYGQPLSVH